MFANKQDIRGCMSAAEISNNLNLTSIKDRTWHIQSCCALTGEGLVQLLTNQNLLHELSFICRLQQGLEWMIAETKS